MNRGVAEEFGSGRGVEDGGWQSEQYRLIRYRHLFSDQSPSVNKLFMEARRSVKDFENFSCQGFFLFGRLIYSVTNFIGVDATTIVTKLVLYHNACS